MKYERTICDLLRSLGVNNSYKGFRYISYGGYLIIHNPELLSPELVSVIHHSNGFGAYVV